MNNAVVNKFEELAAFLPDLASIIFRYLELRRSTMHWIVVKKS